MTEYSNSLDLLKSEYATDSDSEESNEFESFSVRNNVPPELDHATTKFTLPNSLKNLYEDDPNNDDQSSSHCGRLRSFPHERVKNREQLELVCDGLISSCKMIAEFHSCVDFHVSVSRTVVLRYHWIQSFVEDTEKRMKTLKSFDLDFKTLEVYTNDEKTRTFLGLRVQLGYDRLMECVRRVNKSLEDFKLPVYYQDPSFHTSLIWCLGDRKDDVTRILPQLESWFDELKNQEPHMWIIRVDELRCKIGNRLYKFQLSS